MSDMFSEEKGRREEGGSCAEYLLSMLLMLYSGLGVKLSSIGGDMLSPPMYSDRLVKG